MECRRCGEWYITTGKGRPPAYCSTRCRVAAHRERKRIPAELTGRKAWTRADGKRPIRPDGRAASSTDPRTWSSFADVQRGAGDGFGVMLGDGIGCYDLDHVTDDDARRLIVSIPEPIIYTERSKSGDGVHVFVRTDAERGYRRRGIEFYPTSRFICVTGERFA